MMVKKVYMRDIELYQHATSLTEGKQDPEFKKKPTLAKTLIDKSLNRGDRSPNSFNRFILWQ